MVPTAKKVVDIVGQIVPISTATANHSGPGGLRYNVTLDEWAGNIRGSDTFNLASTRVFANTAAGTKYVYFKLRKLRMDPNTQCWVYNAAILRRRHSLDRVRGRSAGAPACAGRRRT